MKITEKKAVTISYTLRNVGGDVLDQATTDRPLAYLHGVGMMLPAFEAALNQTKPTAALRTLLDNRFSEQVA